MEKIRPAIEYDAFDTDCFGAFGDELAHRTCGSHIGAALKELVESGSLARDEIVICTKAGFLAFDADAAADPQSYFISEYINKGVMRPGEIAGGMHCMAPGYLENQLERSRNNLGVETIDVFYVHNPETQLSSGVARSEFRMRLRAAFESLENAVRAGKHVLNEALVARHIDKSDADVPEIEIRKTDIDRNAAALLFRQSIRVDPRQCAHQRRLAVIDVTGGTDDD